MDQNVSSSHLAVSVNFVRRATKGSSLSLMDFPTKPLSKASDQVSPENMLSVRGDRVKSELGGKHLLKGFMLWKNKFQILAYIWMRKKVPFEDEDIYIKLSSDFGNEL